MLKVQELKTSKNFDVSCRVNISCIFRPVPNGNIACYLICN